MTEGTKTVRSTSFLSALNIPCEKYRVIAFVGGGGKTSLIFQLARELVERKKRVIVTTTTHMAYEPSRPFVKDGNPDRIQESLAKYGWTMTAGWDGHSPKVSSLSRETLWELKALCDVLLVEADGAKRLPLKVPQSWEPVIPEAADLVVGVIGLDCLGAPISKTAHRSSDVAAFLGKDQEEPVTEQDVAAIAASGNGLRKGVKERSYRVYLNKAELPQRQTMAEKIRKELEGKEIQAAYGSLKEHWAAGKER